MPYSITTINDAAGQVIVSDGSFKEVVLEDDNAIQAIRDYINGDWQSIDPCPHCKHSLRIRDVHIDDIVDGNSTIMFNSDVTLYSCPQCAYWQFFERNWCHLPFVRTPLITAASSKLSEYSPELPEGTASEISKHIRANPTLWNSINPERLERLFASIIRSNYQHCEVIHTGRTGDGGVDVLFIDDNNKKWLVQVKRREKSRSSEGVKTFRNLLGAIFLHEAKYGIFVSTADHFTTAVHDARNQAEHLGVKVELINKGILDRIVGRLLPRKPWLEVLNHWTGMGMDDKELAHYADILPPLEPDFCKLKLES